MDETLLYSLVAGIGIVVIIVFARFAFRWFIRLVVIAVILAVLGGAAWIWLNSSSSRSQTTRSQGRQESNRR